MSEGKVLSKEEYKKVISYLRYAFEGSKNYSVPLFLTDLEATLDHVIAQRDKAVAMVEKMVRSDTCLECGIVLVDNNKIEHNPNCSIKVLLAELKGGSDGGHN